MRIKTLSVKLFSLTAATCLMLSLLVEGAAAASPKTKQSNSSSRELDATAGSIKHLMTNMHEDPQEAEEIQVEEPEGPVVKDVYFPRYVSCRNLNVRTEPTQESDVIGHLSINTEVAVVGTLEDNYFVKIKYEGDYGYVHEEYLSKTKVEVKPDYEYDGTKLTPRAGTINGPSGKETYYNLPMGRVVSIMHSKGYDYTYWVREDGVKMFGDYVMIAADLSHRPKGSLVPTSLGMGIVCDTGGFVHSNSNQIDIATAW